MEDITAEMRSLAILREYDGDWPEDIPHDLEPADFEVWAELYGSADGITVELLQAQWPNFRLSCKTRYSHISTLRMSRLGSGRAQFSQRSSSILERGEP
jgi:hypothetical protein